jgi:hypothetical protein
MRVCPDVDEAIARDVAEMIPVQDAAWRRVLEHLERILKQRERAETKQ